MDIEKESNREAFEAIPRNARLLRGAIFKDGEYVALSLFDESSKELAAQLNYGWSMWQAAKAQAVPECTWTKNEDGYFDASCSQSFVFSEPEDKPSSHEFTHCCFCGGKLIEAQEPAND